MHCILYNVVGIYEFVVVRVGSIDISNLLVGIDYVIGSFGYPKYVIENFEKIIEKNGASQNQNSV